MMSNSTFKYLNLYYSTTYPKELYNKQDSYVNSLFSSINKPNRGKWLNSFREKLSEQKYMKELISELRFSQVSFLKENALGISEETPYVFYSPFLQEADFIQNTLPHDQKKVEAYIKHNIDYEKLKEKKLSSDDYSRENKKIEKEELRLREKEWELPNSKVHRSLIFEDEDTIERISNIYSNEGYRDLKSIKKEHAEELNEINCDLYEKAISTAKIKGEYRFNVILYLLRWLVGGNFYFHDYYYELNRDIINLLNPDGHFPYRGDINRLNELRNEGGRKYFKIKLLNHIILSKKEGEPFSEKSLINDSSLEYEDYYNLQTVDKRQDQKISDFLDSKSFKHPNEVVRYYITFRVIKSDLNYTDVHARAREKDIPKKAKDIGYNTFHSWVKKWEEFLK